MTTFAVSNTEDILPALNYVLSNLDLNGSGGNGGNANIPGNVLVANTSTGEITTYGGDKYGFFYQYINLRYGNSATGAGFSTVPTNSNWFGTYNSASTTPSANPADYTWTEVAGGFGTTETIYYSAIGGRQVVWVAANSAPSSSFVESVANVAINLDIVTTAAGTPGSRGPVSMAYIVTTSDPNFATSSTLTGWFSASPAGPAAPIGTGLTPVTGDIATFTWAAGAGTPNATNTFNGSVWVPAYAQRIDGNVVIAGTLAANTLVANSITATQIATGSLTTDLFTANTINGNIITVATLNGNAITANTINGNTIIANTISGNTIIANSFNANTINGNSLIIGTVSNTQIANGTITTNQVAANTITANNIAVGANITGNQIAANTITAENLVANALVANTVVSTGATLGSYSSQGFWLDGPSGNARFGNTVSIGNLLTVGGNATIGSNAAIGSNLTVGNNAIIGNSLVIGNNASIGNNLTIGSNLTLGNNISLGGNIVIGANATIGNSLTIANSAKIGNLLTVGANANIGNYLSVGGQAEIGQNLFIGINCTIGNSVRIGANAFIGNNTSIGNNLQVGNNASIGGNLNVSGLIINSGLFPNTVATVNLVAQSVSQGNGWTNINSNVQIFSNTAPYVNSPLAPSVAPQYISLTTPSTGNTVAYLSASGQLTNIFWTQTGTGSASIIFTAKLNQLSGPGGTVTNTFSSSDVIIQSTVAGTNTYGQIINQSPLQFNFSGISQTLPAGAFTYYYVLYVYWYYTPNPATPAVTISNMKMYSYNGSILGQLLKR
jgi:acyl-[acyl carrier protein]--UDP-N-acetylglucosamine O-acyltransferase